MKAAELKEMYRQMLRIRMVEEKIAEVYPQQEMRCPVHLCTGQEAVAVGVCANLRRDDYVFSNHRSHGHYLAKGGDLKALIAELYGKATGCSKGIGGSMHLIDLSAGFLGATPIVASMIPIAVGAAFGSAMRGEKRVVVSFFGDAAVEEGAFHEAINFAELKKLPVVFVCENNLYSVYSALGVRQPEGRQIYRFARAYGVSSYQGDGNNVIEVFKLARRAIQAARSGRGPVFIEFLTYRWREHCGPNYDNDIGYRTESEFLEWKQKDPIERMSSLLVNMGEFSDSESEHIASELREEVDEAFRFAKESPFPEDQMLKANVYAS